MEQGPNAATFSAEQLQSTNNIVRVPRLIHEEITSYYATARTIEGKDIALRDFLHGKSFMEQYEYGIEVLRNVGIMH